MTSAKPATGVTDRRFRALMAGFPSGVVVVTARSTSGEPLGLTCSSLCSVSLDPPLLLVCIANGSRTLTAVTSSGMFAVNLLHCEGQRAARVFSTATPDRFAAVSWSPTSGVGLPCLDRDAHAFAECRVHMVSVAGDHTIVVGRVLSAASLSATPPLLYGRWEYAAWPDDRLADSTKGS
jgi:flavin reductase (DIM6/NTAB) family NADH-FMN oxidoreductase RutF